LCLNIPGACREWLQTLHLAHERPLCDENVAWILDELGTNERIFEQESSTGFIPTRLLDLGTDEADDIQLIETSTLSFNPKYVALSYCWGSPSEAAQQLKTTSSTLQQHYQQLPSDGITKVIKDAVEVTRALSVRYLWIDALCIIQGDDQDWARESQLMGLVYSNSYVTICSLASANCLEGFLDRSSPIQVPFQSSIRPGIAGVISLRRQPKLDNYNYRGPDYSSQDFDLLLSTWFERAWTYQESELSRRKILFGRSRVHLSLMNMNITEADAQRVNSPTSFHDDLRRLTTMGDYEVMYDSWLETAESYAHRQLSDQRDKLPAISGLVRLLAEAIKDDYVAGIWQNDLIRGLLWKTIYRVGSNQSEHLQQCPLPGSATYISPSWSWANHTLLSWPSLTHKSLEDLGKVDHREHSLRWECKSLSAWSRPENIALNPYGRVRDARIYIRSYCMRLESAMSPVSPRDVGQSWQATLQDGSIAICDLDWKGPKEEQALALESVSMLLLASSIGGKYSKQLIRSIQRDEPMDISEAKCLQPAQDGSTSRNAWGLLIHPIGDDKFVRVGRFKIPAEVGGLRAFQACECKFIELL